MPTATRVRDHCLAPARAVDAPTGSGTYRRLFPELAPLDCDDGVLHELGRAGGACDTVDAAEGEGSSDADGAAGRPRDLPRNSQGVALIGDPRNDVHLFMSQLHVAMLHLHNGLVDRLRADGVAEPELLDQARRSATWHYQWVLLRDFLPRLVGAELAGELLTDGPRHYRPAPGAAWIPLEFADAAYRYGHGQIRERYRVNRDADPVPVFPDLLGFRPVPAARTVDWSCLFDQPGRPPAQRARRMDGRLARYLIRLPEALTGVTPDDDYGSLAVRDLQRGQGVGLPSGEAVAGRLGVAPLTAEEVGLAGSGWRQETPLWFYVLKEAEHRGDGRRLGPVGGRIVGEVLVGIVDADGESYRAVDPAWRPTLPAAEPAGADGFGVADLLAFAAAVAGAGAGSSRAGEPSR